MQKKTNRMKGQITTIDLVIACGIFVFVLLTAMWTWNHVVLTIYRFEDKRALNEKATDVAEILVKTAGEPPDWYVYAPEYVNPGNVTSLGFVEKNNILDKKRLDKMADVNYGDAKTLLGLSREEFNITITNVSGVDKTILYSFGILHNKTNVLINRYALLGNDLVKLELRLFYNVSTS